ncbi:transporter substrate-binding domain-containing protein [Chelatococcus sp. SYSU_G07232]|uniref:Transporter substrate-binding domain-containing protein n=1 Tax=Chelatococcus albus TaxID=3047466 RepID=A0ABT7AKC0_9HYPH|nr:transporter substrate-binding domain-containing protein [Chelatococcus sp. SYSU_G07232]MDJ1159808.1 transporter substrate-binding domain-containing protein [Chelatococcus sp. SYSU_G07232]
MSQASRLALVLAAVATITGPALATPGKTWTTVRIATEGAYPPFNYVDATGQLQGFEIDIARALCSDAALTCDFQTQDWESLIAGLRAGRYDAIVASLSITEERRRKIAFSKRYYRTPQALIARKDAAIKGISPADLEGKAIGVQEHSLAADFLDDRYKGVEVKTYATLDEANLDLAVGRIDAVFGDKFALAEWLKRAREAHCCVFKADAPDEPAFFGEGYGIGLRKQDGELKAIFDNAIDAIVANGTYDRIRARYFDFDVR